MKPVLGIVMGDASGVGPEVTVKALAQTEAACRFLVIGDRRTFDAAASLAGVVFAGIPAYAEDGSARIQLLDTANLDPSAFRRGEGSLASARAVIEDLHTALDMLKTSAIAGLVFGPLDKKKLREAGQAYRDEHEMFADYLGMPGEGDAVNVLDGVWAGRVTSHIPLSEVSGSLSVERILKTVRRIDGYLRATGHKLPRIAVSALNPHCGEGGSCGREELDCIIPAIEQARVEGINASGPIPADMICVRTFLQKDFDGIVSMFHDQAQTGIKLLAKRRSITVTGGLPYPICTTSHGTGYDLAGTGRALSVSMEQAIAVAADMIATATAGNS
ncbi:MAG TPA: 4-hydroxythreonine-4-phosphate dehydrogenase PdxA [Candidatus Avidesulfovibrio excrementigallinarum]|nr:4-hydroxythreonine-4-phosphate dehydrogenase PdxA [Candidatus Avidesulfovibrio excrementigallinarum]